MTIREQTQAMEREMLAPWAALSSNTRGRQHPEEECEMRTPYQRDRDRIIHCKSFRRLKHKTQVFLSPEGDHYRTRLTHTLEAVSYTHLVLSMHSPFEVVSKLDVYMAYKAFKAYFLAE